MQRQFLERGFLPPAEPCDHFPPGSELAVLDRWGHDLPSLLLDSGFRQFARELRIPPWSGEATLENLPYMRLYYVRLGFLASAYVNQVGEPPATSLPANIAVPLVDICRRLDRPPILSYDGYALYNWRRFRPDGPIALGNIDTLQNFVHLYDEHWFILVHVEIEALGAEILSGIDQAATALMADDAVGCNQALSRIAAALWRQVAVLRRIPQRMDPALYYRTFRPYIRFFENVVYEGVDQQQFDFRGETGAQSSIVPALAAFLKIPHAPTQLTDHLADMRQFMPREHRALLAEIASLPPVRPLAEREPYNDLLEALATFREVHFQWAIRYIQQYVSDPRGTGGTPFMRWLSQLIDETRAQQIA